MRGIFIVFFLFTMFEGVCMDKEWRSVYQDSAKGALLSPDLSTPKRAIGLFLHYTHPDHYNLRIASQIFARDNITEKKAQRLALLLKQSLDAWGYAIDLSQVPDQTDYMDRLSGQMRYFFISEHKDIYLRHKNGVWQLGSASFTAIEAWHTQLFPFKMDSLLSFLPRLGTKKIGSFYTWQLFLLAIFLFLGWAIRRISGYVIYRIFKRLMLWITSKDAEVGVIRRVTTPMSWMVVLGFLYLFFPLLQSPAVFSHYVQEAVVIILPVLMTLSVYYFIDIFYIYSLSIARRTNSVLDDQLARLIRRILRVLVVLLGGIFFLQALHVSVIPFLTGLSIGGLAFALAAQDTIKNFFGSVMIFTDKPFQSGDWITCGEIDGVVEHIGIRSTRVRTFRDSIVYVPNAKLMDSVIDNHNLRTYRRYYTQLSLLYGTSKDTLEAFILGIRKIVLSHPKTRKDSYEIYFNNFGKRGIEVMVYIFFKVPSWSEELSARHDINMGILSLSEALGLRFPYESEFLLSSSIAKNKIKGDEKK